MKNRQGHDALSLLTDVLFAETDGPVPNFAAHARQQPKVEKVADSPDIVEQRPSWQPAP